MKKNTIIDNELKYIDDEVFSYIRNYTISKSDLYLTIAGTIGDVGEVPDKYDMMNLTENAAKLTNIICNRKYLMYSLLSSHAQEHFLSKFHQVAQPKLSIETASNTFVPIPPMEEQKRIVTKIEELLTIIELLDESKLNLEQAILQAKSKILDLAIHGKLVPQDPTDEPASDLLKRINPKAVVSCDNPHYTEPYQLPNNWAWCSLKNVCTKIVDGDHNPPAESSVETPYMMLSSKNINNDSLVDINNCRFLSQEDWEMCNSRTKLKRGDVLLTTVASLGRSCVYDLDIPFCFQRSVTVITTTINNNYLKIIFDSPYYQALMNDTARGTAQKGFYLHLLEQSLIPIPPMYEQLRIVSKVNELFSKLELIEKSLQA